MFIMKSLTILEGKCYGGNSCCTDAKPCGEGDGDCDSNSHCLGDLICVKGGNYGCENMNIGSNWDTADDCCVHPKNIPEWIQIGQQINAVSAKLFIFSF